MREILFRAKRQNGEWREGSLLFYPDVNRAFISSGDYSRIGGIVEVDKKTVGQYTGLTDKNGKKIFEGDIVESKYTKKPYLVCFGEYTYTDEYGGGQDACGWYNKERDGYATALGNPYAWATVIGNIHDNPELLEVSTDA